MALGIGLATLRSDKKSREDSFGLISLCSIGPILAVLLLGIFYNPTEQAYTAAEIISISTTQDVMGQFVSALPQYGKEVLISNADAVGNKSEYAAKGSNGPGGYLWRKYSDKGMMGLVNGTKTEDDINAGIIRDRKSVV